MDDAMKTQAQLIQEVAALRRRVAHPEAQHTTPTTMDVQGACVHEARLRAMLQGALDGIITIDEQGRIESFNPAAERLFGYTAAEVVGQNVAMLMSPPHREAHDSYLRRYLQTGEKRMIGMRREVIGQRQDGSTFPIELAVSAGRLGDRWIFTGIVRDITARKQTEAALWRTEHLALLGRLAAGVSHDLRSPLSTISLHMEFMQEELRQPSPDSRAQLAESLAEIRTELTRMHELVQDYLSLARLATVRREQADVGAFVKACAQEMEELVTSRGVTLSLCGLASLGAVAFHPSTLRRALANLMQNALEAMPQGGSLTVRGQRTASHVHLAIRDTGVGIPEDGLPLIFEPLHTTKPEGTGLGLYLVREIVAAHEGCIEVHSVPGQGTTFTLTLPRTEGAH